MSRRWYVLRRFAWALVTTFMVFSGLFVLVAAPRDPNALLQAFGAARGGGNASAALESYRSAHGLNRTLLERYLDFLANMVTFQWGVSPTWDRKVSALIAERSVVTAMYVLPSVVFATILGTLVGLYVSIRDSKLLDFLVSTTAYAGYGIPAFWLALVSVALLSEVMPGGLEYNSELSLFATQNLWAFAVPTFVLTATLFAVQLRYVRSEVRENLGADFIKTVRAKGVSEWRVARHAIRTAALTLQSLLLTEFLTILLLAVFTLEVALGLPGLGELLFRAVRERDIPIVMACLAIPIFIGIYGNFVQDVLQTLSDPRIETE